MIRRLPLSLAFAALLPVSVALPSAAAPAAPAGEPVAVPSGRAMLLVQTIEEPDAPIGPTWRLRFVAPGLGTGGAADTPAAIAADMDHLCNAYAIPRLPARPGPGARVVISVAAEWAEFGDTRPEITQFFEAYSIDGARCIWEGL